MIINYKTADRKVSELQDRGIDIQWNGWELEVFTPSKNAFMNRNGAFRNGEWCLKTTHSVNEQGKWIIPNGRLKRA